jgi:diacylglycerol kinase
VITDNIIISGDNSHSYTVFLNYLHAYCSEFSKINYTYEVDYTTIKTSQKKEHKNYLIEHPYILYLLVPFVIMIYVNAYIAIFLLIVCLLLFMPSSDNTFVENVIEQGNYEAEQRPDCLLF